MKRTDMRLFLLAVLLCMAVKPAAAHDIEVANDDGVTIYYNFINDNTELEVTSGPYTGNVVIPQTVNYNGQNYLVTSIGDQAFRNCTGLTSISISNSVTSIGDEAIWGCDGLTSISIPNSVTSIGDCAFSRCSGLTSITVDSENGKYDSRDNCNAIIETATNALIVGCKNTIIPNSVTSIGNSAFRICDGLTSISFPNSVTSIGAFAFKYCSDLTSVSIPNSVTSIGEGAFLFCGLTDVYCYAEIVPTTGSDAFIGSGNPTLHVPASVVETYKATEPWSSFKEVVAIVDDSEAYAVLSPDKTTLSFYYDGLKGSREGTVYTADNFRKGKTGSWGDYSDQITTVVFDESFAAYKGTTDYWFRNCTKLNTIQGMENLKVTSIGNFAFYNCGGLTSISIPNSVTSIGNYAFYGCSGLTSISIPNSVTSIGDAVFAGCRGLTSITVDSENGKYDSRDNCNAIIETATNSLIVGCKNTIISYSVTSIGSGAFYYCSGLTSISIPNSVISIGSYAFNGCSGLTSVIIPNSVTSIGEFAFSSCSGLTSVIIPNSVTSIGESAFSSCSGLTSVNIPNSVSSIAKSAFYGCSGLTSVIIPNSVTSIEDGAFNWCSGLTSISIPNSVTSIGDYTFESCSGLTSISIPNSVTSIGKSAFLGCIGLTSVSIPNSVTSIGTDAFRGCSGLADVYCYAEKVPTTGSMVYYNSNISKATLHVPASAVETYKATEPWSGFKEVVAIVDDCEAYAVLSSDGTTLSFYYDGLKDSREGTVYTADNFRKGNTGSWGNYSDQITTVVFDESFAAYKGATDYWFFDCKKLNTIQGMYNLNVTSIGANAFGDCYGLTSISIPNSVTSIGNYAFSGCVGLTSISIPNSVTSIGNYAFDWCKSLTSISIPNSVTSIGNYAFDGCSGLTSIEVDANNKKYDSRENCNAIIETSTNSLIAGCKNTVIPSSVTSIGDYAFSGCSGLTSISIPNSVTSIGMRTFLYCSGLTSISIPNSVASIGNNAFLGCSSLTDVYCYAEIVPTTGSMVYYNSNISNATLHVPASAVETYKATEPWSGFKEIVAIEEQNDYDWTIGVGGDFADINVAMTDSRVKDGDVLQVLKGNNAITGQQKITKAVTIQGNGYGSLNDGWLNGTLYVDCAGVTVKGLYVSDGIYLRHNDAVIERCRAGFISAMKDYEADDATIRGCFITSFMEGDKTVAPLGWNIHNNIILGQLAYLEDATVNHNAIVYNGDGNIGSDFSMIHGVVESSFTNNIVFIPNKRTSFSSDVLSSLTNFENNIHTNNSNPTNWPTNIYGYETMAKLFACTGKEGTDAYYQTAVGSPAIGYANDGGDCGPWTGSFPYKLNGADNPQNEEYNQELSFTVNAETKSESGNIQDNKPTFDVDTSGSYTYSWTWAEGNPQIQSGNQLYTPVAGKKGVVGNEDADMISALFQFYNSSKDPIGYSYPLTSDWNTMDMTGANSSQNTPTSDTQNMAVRLNAANGLIDGETYHLILTIKQGSGSVVSKTLIHLTKVLPTDLPGQFAVRVAMQPEIKNLKFYIRPIQDSNTWGIGSWFTTDADKLAKYPTYGAEQIDEIVITGGDQYRQLRWAVDARPYAFEEIFRGLIDDNRNYDENYKFVFEGLGAYNYGAIKDEAADLVGDAVMEFRDKMGYKPSYTGYDMMRNHAIIEPGYYLPYVSYKEALKHQTANNAVAVKVGYTYHDVSLALDENGEIRKMNGEYVYDKEITPRYFKADGSSCDREDNVFNATFECAMTWNENNTSTELGLELDPVSGSVPDVGTSSDTPIPYGSGFTVFVDNLKFNWTSSLSADTEHGTTTSVSYFNTKFGEIDGISHTTPTNGISYYKDNLIVEHPVIDENCSQTFCHYVNNQATTVADYLRLVQLSNLYVGYLKIGDTEFTSMDAAMKALSDYFTITNISEGTGSNIRYGLKFEPKTTSSIPLGLGQFVMKFQTSGTIVHQWGHLLSFTSAQTENATIYYSSDNPIPEWQVEPNDLLALKNIHQAFGGDSWTTKKWNFDNNGHYREDFPGVTFTDDGRVTAIDLQDNGLVGECFAVSSPQLSELTTLNLSRNRISGDLGKLVSQLGKLTSLDVSYNRLTKTDGVMAFVEAFSSNINVRYQNRIYQTNSPTTAAFTDDMQTMEAQVVTIGKEMKLTVPSLYTYDYKYQEHRMNPPFKVRLMNSPSVNLGQLTYNGSSNYVNGSTYKFGDCGLYNQPQDQRMVLVDEWGSYARYSAFPVILRYVEGDADMTGATNVLDVQYMVNYILAPSTVGDFNYSAANTYADATINVQDIVQTVNIILGVPRTPNYASRAEGNDDDTMWDGYVYAQQGRIVLTATKDVSAIDIDLEGVSTDEVALMLNRRDFQMIGRNTEWGSRYMIFSPTGKMIPAGTATALLRMSGAGQPVSVECANPQAQAVTVAVGSAPTGIAEVWGEAAQEAFYNLSGQRVANPRKGVYLQRGKKIVVKE